MQHILSRKMIGGKYSKWIIILQQFDLVFTAAKAKKSLIFTELLSYLPRIDPREVAHDPFPDESVYLVDSSDPSYGDILVYLQTQRFCPTLTSDDHFHIHHQSKHYFVLNDTLYRRGVDTILQRCLTFDEAERVLNDCHAEACGGHISGIATAQKILRACYYWPTLFKDCIVVGQKCHPCQIFTKKMCAHPVPLHPVISIGPFAK